MKIFKPYYLFLTWPFIIVSLCQCGIPYCPKEENPAPVSILNKIAGRWTGSGETIFASFNVDTLIIQSNGKIHGVASHWISSSYNGQGVFYMNDSILDDGHNSITIESEDAFGKVSGYVMVRCTSAPGTFYDYQMCLKYIKTNVTNDSLFIAVDEDWTCNQYPWYVRHKLARIK